MPSIQAVLSGAANYSELTEQQKITASLPIYKKACWVLEARSRDDRRARLAEIPESIREQVEAEARRLFEYRKDNP